MDSTEVESYLQNVKALYDLAPWEFMLPTEVFIIAHPESEQSLYCTVDGSSGDEIPALNIHLEQISFLRSAYAHHFNSTYLNHVEAITSMNSFRLAFGDKKHLKGSILEDVAIDEAMFAEDEWPYALRNTPGAYPMAIEQSDLPLLNTVLEQGLKILQLAEDPDFEFVRVNPKKQTFRVLARRPKRQSDGVLAWTQKWETVRLESHAPATPAPVHDELRLAFMAQNPLEECGPWEIFVGPIPSRYKSNETREDGCPLLPYLITLADRDTGTRLQVILTDPSQAAAQAQRVLLDAIEAAGRVPEALFVANMGTYGAVLEVAARLDMAIVADQPLIATEDFVMAAHDVTTKPVTPEDTP